MIGRGKSHDTRPGHARNVAGEHGFTELRHQQHAAPMASASPDRQGGAPFLQARAEIFRAINRIEDGNPLLAGQLLSSPALLSDQSQAGNGSLQQRPDFTLQEYICCRDRASIHLPDNIIPHFLHTRHNIRDKIPHAAKQFLRRRRQYYLLLAPLLPHRRHLGQEGATRNQLNTTLYHLLEYQIRSKDPYQKAHVCQKQAQMMAPSHKKGNRGEAPLFITARRTHLGTGSAHRGTFGRIPVVAQERKPPRGHHAASPPPGPRHWIPVKPVL